MEVGFIMMSHCMGCKKEFDKPTKVSENEFVMCHECGQKFKKFPFCKNR